MCRFIGLSWFLAAIVTMTASPYAHPSHHAHALHDEAEAAYRYLESLPAQWAGIGTPSETNGEKDCRTYSSAHIRGLTRTFAIRVAAMARAYHEETGVLLMVLSAYRSAEDQECVCKNVPKHCAGWRRITIGTDTDGKPIYEMKKTGGVSRHAHGTAIDMRPAYADPSDDAVLSEAYRDFHGWLKERHRRFALCHPLFHIGDRAHIEPLRHRHHRAKRHKKRHHMRHR